MFTDYIRALKLIWQADPQNAVAQLIAQLLMAIFPVAILFSLKSMFDAIAINDPVLDVILYWLAVLAGLTLLQSGVTQWLSYLSATHQQRLTDFVAGQILDKSIHIPYTYFEDHSYHDSLHLAQRQSIFRLPQVFQQFQLLFTNILSLVLLVAYFFSLIASYAWIILLIAIPVAGIKWYSGFALHRLEKKLVPTEREATYYHMIMTGEEYAREIRTLNFGSAFLKRFSQLREMIYVKKRGLQRRLLVITMSAELVEVGVFFAIIYGVINQAFLGLVTIGMLVVYIQGLQKIQSNLKAFLNALVQLVQQRIFLRDIFMFLDIEYNSMNQGVKEFPVQNFDINIQNLSYTYPGSKKPAINSVNIHLKKGQMIGLVGANGSGKSTLVKLLAGLYNPDQGTITVGGHPLQEINADLFRNSTSFLLQDFEKYFLSIEDIVVLGGGGEQKRRRKEEKEGRGEGAKVGSRMEGSTRALKVPSLLTDIVKTEPSEKERRSDGEERLYEALKKADAMDFVDELPHGVKTKMGRIFRDGTQLSGGQWQKLSIARAFYRNPSVVVLDEPTSALDAIAEHKIFKHFKSEATDRVTLIISHRLYNLKDAHYIYVMDEGEIVQKGTYAELIEIPGVFKSLYEQQMT